MKIDFEITGSSHGEYVGAVSSAFGKGFEIDFQKLELFMAERAPGKSNLTTGRKEDDKIIFESGVTDGRLDGKAIILKIRNNDVKRGDYDEIKDLIRPGTSDYTAKIKYGADYSNSGSGRFSGRMTAPICALGGIILQILEARGIYITSELASVGEEKNPENFNDVILKAKSDGDSVGGTVKCVVSGNIAGIGGPLFEGVESTVSMRIFGIPGVKAIEFGNGFESAKKYGSGNNDELYFDGDNVKFKSNNAGGILGGIASGEPLEFVAYLKPTPSIAKKQNTVNLKTKQNAVIEIGGRHDPCIAVRAVPVVRAMAAIAIYELLDEEETIDGLREKLNGIDMRIAEEYTERIKTVRKIGKLKKASGKRVYSESREKDVLENVLLKACGDETAERGLRELYNGVLSYSRSIQEKSGKKCGLLGKKLGHSISPEIHALLGDYGYGLFETDDPVSFLNERNFDAINVTVPYKKIAAETVDELRGEACLTGVVNTIVNEDGKLVGFNTDCFGFETLLKTSGISPKGKNCLILGNGGAARAVEYVLKKLGAKSISIMKRGETPDIKAQIIVNATPVGMWPNTDDKIIDVRDFKKAEAVVDLIYNPVKTMLLREAKLLGLKTANGLMMLVAQAVYASRLFTGGDIHPEPMVKESYKIFSEIVTRENIVLIGMPGSGKTTVGRKLAGMLGKDFYDTDEEIAKKTGRLPKEIIREDGENEFRRIETEVTAELSKKDNVVLATGGGAVTREENYYALAENAIICLLDTPLEMLAKEGRPLTETKGVEKIYKERSKAYENWADVRF